MILSIQLLTNPSIICDGFLNNKTIVSFFPDVTNGQAIMGNKFISSLQKPYEFENTLMVLDETDYNLQNIRNIVLTEKEYEQELNQFILFMNELNQNLSFIDSKALYEDYKQGMEISPMSSVVNIIDSGYERVDSGDKYLYLDFKTCGVDNEELMNFDSFVHFICITYPYLELTHVNINFLYKRYLSFSEKIDKSVGIKRNIGQYPSILDVFGSTDELQYFVNSLQNTFFGKELTFNEIKGLRQKSTPEIIYKDYIKHMLNEYNISISSALAFLNYGSLSFLDLMEKQKESLGKYIPEIKNRKILFDGNPYYGKNEYATVIENLVL